MTKKSVEKFLECFSSEQLEKWSLILLNLDSSILIFCVTFSISWFSKITSVSKMSVSQSNINCLRVGNSGNEFDRVKLDVELMLFLSPTGFWLPISFLCNSKVDVAFVSEHTQKCFCFFDKNPCNLCFSGGQQKFASF